MPKNLIADKAWNEFIEQIHPYVCTLLKLFKEHPEFVENDRSTIFRVGIEGEVDGKKSFMRLKSNFEISEMKPLLTQEA